jgi:hypothetical protein
MMQTSGLNALEWNTDDLEWNTDDTDQRKPQPKILLKKQEVMDLSHGFNGLDGSDVL